MSVCKKVKGRDQKRMAKVDPLKEVPEAQISRIMSTSNRLIWQALQEGRKERDAAAMLVILRRLPLLAAGCISLKRSRRTLCWLM